MGGFYANRVLSWLRMTAAAAFAFALIAPLESVSPPPMIRAGKLLMNTVVLRLIVLVSFCRYD